MDRKRIVILAGCAGSGKDTVGAYLRRRHHAITIAQADPLKRFVRDVFGFTDEQLWGASALRNQADAAFARTGPWRDALLEVSLKQFDEHATQWLEDVLPHDNTTARRRAAAELRLWHWELCAEVADGRALTPRLALQTLGTEWGRHLQSDIWTSYALRTANLLRDGMRGYSPRQGLLVRDIGPPPLVVITDGRFKNEISAVREAGGVAIRIERGDSQLRADVEAAGIRGHSSELELAEMSNQDFDAWIENGGGLPDLYAAIDHILASLYPEQFSNERK
jgi:hypothetical protein